MKWSVTSKTILVTVYYESHLMLPFMYLYSPAVLLKVKYNLFIPSENSVVVTGGP